VNIKHYENHPSGEIRIGILKRRPNEAPYVEQIL
jgi:hypothetical protein